MKKFYPPVKRLLDIFFALILAIPALIIIGGCYVAIKLETHGSAFFIQERPGYKCKIFKIYKLRTMIVETERDGRVLTDIERLTKTGRIIRKLSLDELPQLLNVLKGEMSFIGPRPLLLRYLPYYTETEMHRHGVRPGISGLAQVNGRNTLSWNERLKYDVGYSDNLCISMDFKIIYKTIRNVLTRSGIIVCPEQVMSDLDIEREGMRNDSKNTITI
jgi:lipopolysaccharide/colanic/teichoic acid biosynthesis glycosyltransferase